MVVRNEAKDRAGAETMTELTAALAMAPNNSILGSSASVSVSFMGCGFIALSTDKRDWGSSFSQPLLPVLISTVNPDIRAKVGTNLLHDYGSLTEQWGIRSYLMKESTEGKRCNICRHEEPVSDRHGYTQRFTSLIY
ncbi:MAG: hypothetical protein R2738_03550 [Bacteroides graminisolvens]